MVYTKQTWVQGSTTAINKTRLDNMEQGIYDAHALAAQAMGSQAAGGSPDISLGEVLVDTLTSSTDDDDMLLAADLDHRNRMGDSSNTKFARRYRLGMRRYTFSQVFYPTNGFRLKGSGWLQSSVTASSSHPSATTQVKLAIVPPAGSSTVAWIDASKTMNTAGTFVAPIGGALWDFNIGDMNIYSDRTDNVAFRGPYVDNAHQGYRECAFHNLVCQKLYSVFGTVAEGMAITICDISGPGWQIAENLSQSVTLQGSDNGWIFGDGCDWFNIAGTAGNQQYMGEFRALGKSNIGPIYVTAFGKFQGIKVGVGASVGGCTMYGAKLEGNNEGQECDGNLLRINGSTGGSFSMVGCTIDDGMANPSLTTTANGGTAARGLIEVTGQCDVGLHQLHFAHGNTPPITTPVLYASGTSNVYLSQFLRFQRGQSWGTQKPVVSGNTTGTLSYDASVLKV